MFSYLRSVLWMCPLVGLATVVMGSISFVASLFDATGRLQHRVAVAWARLLLKVCMVRIDVIGAEQLDPSQVYVFCSNHFSLIDTPVMFGSIPREFRILARHGLWRVPDTSRCIARTPAPLRATFTRRPKSCGRDTQS
jgi:1-acyl-sn-glycerol-3-phosphate acyltransferase